MDRLSSRHVLWWGWAGSWGTLVRPGVCLAPKTALFRSNIGALFDQGDTGEGCASSSRR
jgi:hypothetical protein